MIPRIHKDNQVKDGKDKLKAVSLFLYILKHYNN